MSDKKQTAVQWLVTQFNSNIDFIPIDKWDMIRDLVQQALQMEREQIIDAFSEGTKMININDELSARFNACVYYVENYECQDEN